MKRFISLAKNLRKRSTDTEKFLWKYLKAKQLGGYKFRRQEPVGQYIVDFVCFERRVIVECDGGQHVTNAEKDQARDRWFERQGYRVLRFWDNEVLQNAEEVLKTILDTCKASPSPPSPPIKGGEI